MIGRLVEVDVIGVGTALTADVAAGATVLPVSGTGDFPDDSGRLLLGGSTYDYVATDDTTITLAAGLDVAQAEAVPVSPATFDASEQAEWRAWVQLDDDGKPAPALIETPMRGWFVEGVRDAGALVEVELVGGGYRVRSRPMQEPVFDGGVIDPATLPATATASDGLAPATAPTLTLIAGIGSLFFRWTETPNPDPVTYRLYVDDVAPVATTAANLAVAGVGLTAAAVRRLPTGEAVDPSGATTYYAVVVAEDADGSGPASVQVSGVPAQVTGPDIAVNALTTDHLTANSILAPAIDATDMSAVTVTGATVQSSAAESVGVKFDNAGIRAYNPALTPFFVVDLAGGVTIVEGTSKLATLTVTEGSGLGGITEVTRSSDGSPGAIRLTVGTTAPKSAPTVIAGYDQQQFTDDGQWGDRSGWSTDGTHWYTSRIDGNTVWLEKWDAAGSRVAQANTTTVGTNAALASCVVGGGSVYVLQAVSGAWRVYVYTTALVKTGEYFWRDADGSRAPAIGWDAADAVNPLLIAQSKASDDRVTIRRYPVPATSGASLVQASSVTHDDQTLPFHLSTLLAGSFDFGASRLVFGTQGPGTFHTVLTTTGDYPAGDPDSWESGMQNRVGCGWDGTRFKAMDRNGVMRIYTGIKEATEASRTRWVSSTLRNLTYETDQSPRAKIVLPNRAKLTVTTSAINTGTGGATNPDRVRVYVGQGATDPGRAQMARQGADPAVGVTTVAYTTLTPPPGVNPPATNGFPGGTVQRLENAVGAVLWDGNGIGPAGVIAVDARADARIAVNLRVGTFTGTTDAVGDIYVPHTLGAVPASVGLTTRTSGALRHVEGGLTSTQIRVRCFDTVGTTRPAGVSVALDWQVFK